MLRGEALSTALAKAELISVGGPWSRVIGLRHLKMGPEERAITGRPLWGGAARPGGARFTPKDRFDSLYLSRDSVTALLEVQALVIVPGTFLSLRTPPWAVVTVDGAVSRVLDLTSPAILKSLETDVQEMTGPWAAVRQPPTQELGQACFETAKIAGIQYGSAKHPGGVNLVIFPDRLTLAPSDFLEVYDPHGNLSQRIGS